MTGESSPHRPRHIVVMGVSGSGKSTVARALAERLGWAFAEADKFHPPENVAKMQGGTPLTDEDRWPWLRALRDWMTAQAQAGHSTVVTCSALRRSYRDVLREAPGEVTFIFLSGRRDLLAARLAGRRGHFMPASLLDSQLATLEVPGPDEHALTLNIGAAPDELVREVLAGLQLGSTASLSSRPGRD